MTANEQFFNSRYIIRQPDTLLTTAYPTEKPMIFGACDRSFAAKQEIGHGKIASDVPRQKDHIRTDNNANSSTFH
jgi:hypothetical protein